MKNTAYFLHLLTAYETAHASGYTGFSNALAYLIHLELHNDTHHITRSN